MGNGLYGLLRFVIVVLVRNGDLCWLKSRARSLSWPVLLGFCACLVVLLSESECVNIV